VTVFRSIWYLMLFIAGCSPLGDPVDPEVSNSYYYSPGKDQILYSPQGNWFERELTEMPEADVESFKPLSSGTAVDKQRVFFTGEILQGADRDTYRDLPGGYAMDKRRVYFLDDVLEETDPEKFTVVASRDGKYTEHYGKDDKTIYCSGDVLSREPERFHSIAGRADGHYFADSRDVYNIRHCDALGADPGSFRILLKKDGSRSTYAADRHKVFTMTPVYRVIPGADPASFQALCSGIGPDYAVDKNRVYRWDKVVEGANPDDFTPPDDCKRSRNPDETWGDGLSQAPPAVIS